MNLSDRIAYGTGTFLVILGIVIGFIWPFVFDYVLLVKLKLSPSSESYKLWEKTPLPMYLDVYLFNWTNSQEFLKDKKLKPEFEEIGPFVFKEIHERVDVKWNDNNSVSYNQTRSWMFVPEESLDLSTPITNLNVIVTTVTKMATHSSELTKVLLNFLNYIYKEKLIITKPANEWMFDGISDKLLDFIKIYIHPPLDKFGWFYKRNMSSSFDGRFTVSTGQDNIYSLGEMEEWNYVNKTNFYNGECGVVRGTTGEIISPLKNSPGNFSIFISDFCGPLTLKYSGVESIEGLDGYRYVGDETVFDNGTSYPDSKCFCTGQCSPSGVRNVTLCRQAPLFISFPHFYLADPIYTESVNGMFPNKSEHEFYLSIDPVSGIPLEVRAQIQLNVLLEPLWAFPMFKDVPKVYVPMMWFRQRVKVTPELASRGKILRILEGMGLWLACAFGLIGVLVIVTRLLFVKISSRREESDLLISPDGGTKQEESQEENER